MKRRVTRLEKSASVLLLLCTTGCKVGWLIDGVAPDAVREGKNYFEELRLRQGDQLLQSFDPSGDKGSLRTDLGKVIALVPQQEPIGVETVGATVKRDWGSRVSTKVIALEYKYPDRWILFRVTISDESGRDAITELSVQDSFNTGLLSTCCVLGSFSHLPVWDQVKMRMGQAPDLAIR